jgi:hypothetical protein
METLKPDDFASLLAALGRTTNASVQQQAVQMQPQVAPAVVAPAAIAAPLAVPPPQQWVQPAAPSVAPPVVQEKSKTTYLIVIIVLLVAVLVFAGIAWMRSVRTKEEPEEEEEEEDIHEIPPPSSVTYAAKKPENYSLDEDFVANNLLRYVEKKPEKNFVDLSGLDLPFEEEVLPRETRNLNKKIVDDSDEVLEYAKKREQLFKD